MARIFFRDMGTATANRIFSPFLSTSFTSVVVSPGTTWPARNLTIDQFTATAPAAPGVGTAVDFQANVGDNVPTGDRGSAVSLSGTNTSVRGTMAAGLDIAGGKTATAATVREILTGSPTGQAVHTGISYTCANPDEKTSLYGWGQAAAGIFTPATTVYLKPGSNRFSSTLNSTMKVIWPQTGVFKYFVFVTPGGGVNWDGNVTLSLHIDGGSSITFTPTNAVDVFTDYVQTLAVTTGDVVYWQAVRNSGALNPAITLNWGFGSA